jgi:N-formylglutamate amidohydrolase
MKALKSFWIIISLCAAACGAEVPPQEVIFGSRRFIEYQPGTMPLIIAAPHGGREKPADLPDRTQGVVDMDANTQELARAVVEAVQAATGGRPHLVVCHLHRSKLDANRDLPEAAQGNAAASQAWREHHGFIEEACRKAVKDHGVAFLIDMHGHGHPDPRVELGYLFNASELAEDEQALNSPAFVQKSSLRWLVEKRGIAHIDLLRGPFSLGALLEQEGFPATPSPGKPVPGTPFFRGGYTIVRHCKAEAGVTGLQIEANRPRLRDTPANRQRFAQALAASLKTYFSRNLGITLGTGRASK